MRPVEAFLFGLKRDPNAQFGCVDIDGGPDQYIPRLMNGNEIEWYVYPFLFQDDLNFLDALM